MQLSNEDSTLSTLSFYNQFFNWKIGFMYCIVYFVPAKSVDYHPRYVTQLLLYQSLKIEFKECSLKIDFEECSLKIEFKESSLRIEG